MHDILAKPAAIATCGLFNMKRRAKEALPAQGSIEWVVIVVWHRRRADRRAGLSVQPDEHQDQHGLKTLAGTNVNGANTPS